MPRVVLADELSEVVPRFLDPASVASLGCVDRAWARTVAADSCQEAAFKLFLRTEGWELQEVDWISLSREPPINWQERKASYFSDSLAFQCGESSVTLAENFTDQPVDPGALRTWFTTAERFGLRSIESEPEDWRLRRRALSFAS